MSGFSINVAEVRVHTRTVATVASTARSATGAAQSVSSNAYGVIGAFFASAIMSACGDVFEGITKVATAIEDVRKGLEDVIDEYERIDGGNADTFTSRIGGAR